MNKRIRSPGIRGTCDTRPNVLRITQSPVSTRHRAFFVELFNETHGLVAETD